MNIYFFKILFGIFKKEKLISIVNILGLVIGLSCSVFIFLWNYDENSYEEVHKNADNIYSVNTIIINNGEERESRGSVFPMAPGLALNFPEIINYYRIEVKQQVKMKCKENVFIEKELFFIDSSFFQILTFNFIEGNPTKPFITNNSMVISESARNRYFGDNQAIGSIITVDINGKEKDFTVSGVVKDMKNSRSACDFYPSNASVDHNMDNWRSFFGNTYVLLLSKVNIPELEKKMSAWFADKDPKQQRRLRLQPLKDIRFYDNPGREHTISMLRKVIVLILIITGINYIILSIVRNEKRLKEVFVKQTLGSDKFKLIFQFLGEALIRSLLIAFLVMLMIVVFLPLFNKITEKQIEMNILYKISIPLFMVIVLVSFIAGIFPALNIAMKRSFSGQGKNNNTLSKIDKLPLLIQLFLTAISIFFSFVIYKQYKFLKNKDLGYNVENMIIIPGNKNIIAQFNAFKAELLKNPDIVSVAASGFMPHKAYVLARELDWQGRDQTENIFSFYNRGSVDILKTLEVDIVEGEDFTERNTTARNGTLYLLSEEAVRQMNLSNPLGTKMTMLGEEGEVIGVFKDFQYQDFKNDISPFIIRYGGALNQILLRLSPYDLKKSINEVKEVYNKFMPEYPFSYKILHDDLEQSYFKEVRQGRNIFIFFSVMCILVSSIGLFAISYYNCQLRTKEIGIRKALGGSVPDILLMFNARYLILILVSMIFAMPLAYYVSQKWLQNYAYKIHVNIWIFVPSLFLVLFIFLTVININTIKFARKDPTKTLSYE